MGISEIFVDYWEDFFKELFLFENNSYFFKIEKSRKKIQKIKKLINLSKNSTLSLNANYLALIIALKDY